jgi:modulator of FtsH protease
MPEAAYDPALWSTFLSAQTSASASLTGLVFVAISINLGQIIALGNLVARAAKALLPLLGTLIASTLCLVPGQPIALLGVELMVLGALVWITTMLAHRAAEYQNPHVTTAARISHRVLTQGCSVPWMVCGVSLLLSRGGGLYWLVPGIVFSFVGAVADAWVLLIEIRR